MNSAASSPKQQNKIVWAVDPLQNPAHTLETMKEITLWAKQLNCRIQPVSIFSSRTLNLPAEIQFSWDENFTEKWQQKFFTGHEIKDILPIEKIFVQSHSLRKMAAELVSYAAKEKAIIIFANSRNKQNMNPFRFGGFTEALVTLSQVPVLLLNPDAKASIDIKNILFPTDFSAESAAALSNLTPWAKAFSSKITIFSDVETPTIYLSEIGYWPAHNINLENLIKSIEDTRNDKAQQWIFNLKKNGIEAAVAIQRQLGTVGTDIVKISQEQHVDLIAIASQSGPLTRVVLGSVARDVLLQAKCPVLIFYRNKENRKISRTDKTAAYQKEADNIDSVMF